MYNDLREQDSCKPCPEGFFCLVNTTNFYGNECPMGFYCPEGTEFSEQYPCPAGRFNNRTNARGLADCLLSPPGTYSQGLGNKNPSGSCQVGYYCPEGATSSAPTCASDRCSTGGACFPGVECPMGTGEPVPCRGGHYCADSSGIVTGQCMEGHYCVQVL